METKTENMLSRKQFLREHKKKSFLQESIRMFIKNKLAVFGLIVLTIIIAVAIFADVIADYENVALMINPINRLQPPSAEHWFGTDELGRDVFARVIHGARISLSIGTISTILSLLMGGILGAIAGYYGGIVDTLLMRFTDIFVCLPDMLLAIAIVAAFGNTQTNLILAIGIARSPTFARIVRSSVLSVTGAEYVEAARAIGATDYTIILKHVLINCMGPIIVQFTLGLAGAVFCVSSLSFIGLGIPSPAPEWGSMLSAARSNMRDHMNLVLAPGLAIFATIFSLNIMGDGVRDALDPKLRK